MDILKTVYNKLGDKQTQGCNGVIETINKIKYKRHEQTKWYNPKMKINCQELITRKEQA
jgi:hypothetical protein